MATISSSTSLPLQFQLLHLLLLYIPMSQYDNPLHMIPNAQGKYSTLSGALGHHPATTSPFHSRTRKRVPQVPFTPSAEWRLHRSRDRGEALQHPITFDYRGCSRQGVYMSELLHRAPQMQSKLDGANDMVLKHTRLTKITFHIIVSTNLFSHISI